MSDSIALAIRPIVRYPCVAQVGKTYLMTIDLEVEPGAEWQYEEEEYPVYCEVDSELFKTQIVGEPVIMLHRFGGSYGEANFLLTAASEAQEGNIKVSLINAWGVRVKTINLEEIQLLLKDLTHTIADIEGFTTVAHPSTTASDEKPIVKNVTVQEDSVAPEITVGFALVVTALPIEYIAVRSHLQDLREEVHVQGTIYERGKFSANSRNWEVGIVEIGAGNVGATLEAERAIAHFKPDVILFVGAAGGIKNVAIGDVVVSTKIYGYESGKAEQHFKPRPEIGLSAYNLVQRARVEARKGDWLERLAVVPEVIPSIFIAPIAAGEKIIASTQSEMFQFLRENYGDAIAVEMEGLGFLDVARVNYHVEMIVIRGISDLINENYYDGTTDKLESIVLRQDIPKNQQISAIAIREASNSTDGMTTDRSSSQKLAACHASAFAFEVLARFRQVPNNVPRSGVSNFIGRDAELEWLHTQLQSENPILILAIEGMGGVGKTELAIQYTQQHSLSYEGGVCWVLGREFNIGTQIINFAQSRLNLKIPEGLELIDQVNFCWRNWREGEVLLILDNVVDYPGEIKPFLPPSILTRFRVLITTRRKLGSSIRSLSLPMLSSEKSIEMLTALIGGKRVQQELKVATILCAWLGYLPLGIELVGYYLLKRTSLSLAILLSRLQNKSVIHPALNRDEKDSMSTNRYSIKAAFELSWLALDYNSQRLGKLLGLFACAPIPWHLIESIERKYCENSEGRKKFEIEEFENARDQLIKLNLLQIFQQSGQIYHLHSLVREFFRIKLEESDIKDLPNSDLVSKSVNIQNMIHILSNSAEIIQESLQSELETMLYSQEVESYQIPDDNHVGTIQSVEDLKLLHIYSEHNESCNNEKLKIPFKAHIGSTLGYFIFKADYYSLDEERDISVDENNDHTFSAEEYYSLELEGIILIDLNFDELEDSILSDNKISEFLSEVEISVEPITHIEVLAQNIRHNT